MEATMEQPQQQLTLIDYTEKSFIVYGEATKQYIEQLKGLKGRFNGNLKERPDSGFEGGAGWIFRMNRKEEVEQLVDQINSGEYDPNALPGMDGNTLPTIKGSEDKVYQYVKFKVFIPKEGMKVILKAGGVQREGVVLKTETHNDIVDTVELQFGEDKTLGVIARQAWQVWGYNPKHSLFFSNE